MPCLSSAGVVDFMDEKNWSLDLAEEINHLLISKNIADEVKRWLKTRGFDSEECLDDQGRSALMVACAEGEFTVAESLVLGGADVDHRDVWECTPLMLAVQHGHEELVKLLLKHGADVNMTMQGSCNALFTAAKLGFIPIVNILLQHEDKIHISDAVTHASRHGFTSVADLLLEHMDWWTPLIQSSRLSCGITEARTADDMLEPADSSYTALMIAAFLGHVDTIEAMIRNGSEIDKQTGDGWSALMLAACFRQRGAAEILLRHGAAPDLYTMDGKTALQLAAYNGYMEIVDALCRNGADPNLAPYCRFSPLILAASNGHAQVVELLLNRGCNRHYKAPVTEKIELRKRPGQGKYERRLSGVSKKYIRAIDVSVLFGFNECTQMLQQEVQRDRSVSACSCSEEQDEFEDESLKHKHKELCNRNNRRHGVFISGNEMDTFMKQIKNEIKVEEDASDNSSLAQDDDNRESSSSDENANDINAVYLRQLLDAYCAPTNLRVIKSGSTFCVYFNKGGK